MLPFQIHLSMDERDLVMKTLTFPNNTPLMKLNKPRVLILDEDRIILQSLSQFLSREGYDVRTADEPADALGILEGSQIELLLADINMPGLKAAEFLRSIRRRHRHHQLWLDRRRCRGDQAGRA